MNPVKENNLVKEDPDSQKAEKKEVKQTPAKPQKNPTLRAKKTPEVDTDFHHRHPFHEK